MNTLEKMEKDAADFATAYGLENPYTIRLYQLYEDSQKFLAPDEIAPVHYELWGEIVKNYKELAKYPQ